MHRRTFLTGLLAGVLPLQPQAQPSCKPLDAWQAWAHARARLISPQGRVIDASDARAITTSEGQSYALFMALVDNDRELFRSLLHWTSQNLAKGDLGVNLPAWLWGQLPNGNWGVLDDNSASDSDLWIAYCLLEAGRLWRLHEYTSLGTRMLQIIARLETLEIPGLGHQLLPAPKGFAHDGRWRLNASYLPPPLLARARQAQPQSVWPKIYDDSIALLTRSSPLGLAPDWIKWTGSDFDTSEPEQHVGSYDAIRVYLWVGLMADDAPDAHQLKTHFRAISKLITPDGQIPEEINTLTASGSGLGPPGFTAALQPLFQELDVSNALDQFMRLHTKTELGYYNQMLVLFSHGWLQGRYRFNAFGQLQPHWEDCTP